MTTAGDRYVWQFREKDCTPIVVPHSPRLMTDSFDALREAAANGVGVAYLPYFTVHDLLANGELERVLPEFGLPPGVVHVVFPVAARNGPRRAHLDRRVGWGDSKERAVRSRRPTELAPQGRARSAARLFELLRRDASRRLAAPFAFPVRTAKRETPRSSTGADRAPASARDRGASAVIVRSALANGATRAASAASRYDVTGQALQATSDRLQIARIVLEPFARRGLR